MKTVITIRTIMVSLRSDDGIYSFKYVVKGKESKNEHKRIMISQLKSILKTPEDNLKNVISKRAISEYHPITFAEYSTSLIIWNPAIMLGTHQKTSTKI